jgi:hypothetical protein
VTENAEPLPGDLLDGRYRLVAQIGQGGMARVFRADDTALGRTVAVKVLRPGVEGAGAPERARSEVTLLASLNHPSLVTLFDAHLTGTPDYLVMEFVDGPTLSARIAEGPLSSAEAAGLAAELGEALHVVHASGVVHRDVKPSNVLLAEPHLPGARPRAKLADFGIALLLDSARVTTPGTVIGTAAYLAPEQVQGADPAPPADVYALGLVLLEALTGNRAYPHTDSVGAALARLSASPVIPEALGDGWVSLLERMTALRPADRPTALEVVAAAGELRTGTHAPPPVLAPPVPPVPAAVAAGIPVEDPPTRRYPTAESVAPARAAAAGEAPAPRRSRRPVAIAIAVGAVALVAAGTIWGTSLVGSPVPASTDPAQTEPRSTEPAQVTSTDPAPAPTPTTVPADVAEEDAVPAPDEKDADKAAKEAEKRAEEAVKRAEDAAKKAEREAEKREKDKPGND